MAVYFDFPITTTGDKIIALEWHNKIPLLAIATYNTSNGGAVNFYRNEGEIWSEMSVSKVQQPIAISWHPKKPVLAISWETGEVCIWSQEDGGKLHEVSKVHVTPVEVIVWSGAGTRLLTGDQSGGLSAWKIDAKGRVQGTPLFTHNTDSAITCATLMSTIVVDKDALYFKKMAKSIVRDISALAKAAVSGDEKALDLMSWRKPKGVKFTSAGSQEANNFYVASSSGTLLYVTEDGEVNSVGTAEGRVTHLFYLEEHSALVVATNSGMLSHFLVQHSGHLKEQLKVKLAMRSSHPCFCWTGGNCSVIAMALGENMVRMWDIVSGDNYTLTTETAMGYADNAKINTIAYSKVKNVLAAGTAQGQVAFWSYSSVKSSGFNQSSEPEAQWQLQPPSSLQNAPSICQLHWGSQKDLLAVSTGDAGHAFLLNQHVLSTCYQNSVICIQTGAYSLYLSRMESQQGKVIHLEDPIKALFTTNEHLVIWNGKSISVNELVENGDQIINPIHSFNSESKFVLMHEHSIFTVEGLKIQVRNLQGTVKQLLSFNELEGEVSCINICGNYFVCCTEKGCVKVYDLSRREAKQVSNTKFLSESLPGSPNLQSIAVNCDGTMVSVIVDYNSVENGLAGPNEKGDAQCSKSVDEFNPRLYIWDVELDSVQYFNMASGLAEQEEYDIQSTSKANQDKSKSDKDKRKSGLGRRKIEVISDDDLTTHKESPDNKLQLYEGETSSKIETAKDIAGRYPVRHIWDCCEPKLLVVEAKLSRLHKRNSNSKVKKSKANFNSSLTGSFNNASNDEPENLIVSFFVTQDSGILVQDHYPMHANHGRLVAVDVPYHLFAVRTDLLGKSQTDDSDSTQRVLETGPTSGSDQSKSDSYVGRRTMRDFVGLEEADKSSKEAMMSFSYYLTLGNMDEAFKAMKLIKSESVWHNMARMCVKTRRLDVASVCLGKMGFARGAMMLRQAKAQKLEPDAQVAVLAMQLGMTEDAERLLRRCKRFDILNKFYQSLGLWTKALEVAETSDRIHLRSTCYNLAKFQEAHGDIEGAMKNYMKSETFRFEIPRMLLDTPEFLESFINKHSDTALNKWWAQYMESMGEMDVALRYYEAAKDYLSLVRVHCYLGNDDQAAQICNETGDQAACYHLARQYENQENVDQAIHFFSRARAYSSAIRLCKEHDRDAHLVNLALLGKPADMFEAAHYLEKKKGYEDRAVILYHKSGHVSKAVDLAFRTKQFGALQDISFDLSDKTDPTLLQKCADFFMANQQYDRAVDLMAAGKQYWEALKFCVEYNVPMTDDLAEKLTPVKPDENNSSTIATISSTMNDSERTRLLEGIAEVCMNQRQYHLACKKFTQAGNRQMAMKALLKSGDTEKIIFFANVSKQREIYVMAANFLQTVDWRRDPDVMKSIILFYTKGKALESLASFYEACAQVEIDEYHNYEKAIGALGESFKCLNKVNRGDDSVLQDQHTERIRAKVAYLKKFLTAKTLLENNSEEGLQECQNLLEDSKAHEHVNRGDIYGIMVEQFAQKQKFKAAYACLEEMKQKLGRGSSVNNFVSPDTIQSIYSALNMQLPRSNGLEDGKLRARPAADDEEVEDNVPEALDDDY